MSKQREKEKKKEGKKVGKEERNGGQREAERGGGRERRRNKEIKESRDIPHYVIVQTEILQKYNHLTFKKKKKMQAP